MYFPTLQTGVSLHSTVSVGQEKKFFFHTILNTFSIHLNGSCGQECTHIAQTGGTITNTLQGQVIMVGNQEWDYGSAGLQFKVINSCSLVKIVKGVGSPHNDLYPRLGGQLLDGSITLLAKRFRVVFMRETSDLPLLRIQRYAAMYTQTDFCFFSAGGHVMTKVRMYYFFIKIL